MALEEPRLSSSGNSAAAPIAPANPMHPCDGYPAGTSPLPVAPARPGLAKTSPFPSPFPSRILSHLPNAITISRILLIPVFVVLFLEPTPKRSLAAAAVFGLAALTDAIDGYLARRLGHVTNLGKLLDPIADKLLVLTALFLLVDFDRIDGWLAIVLAGRELFVTSLRGVAAREGVVLAAETTGKYKMAAQVVAILLLILDGAVPSVLNLHLAGLAILVLSMVLSLVSAVQYWRQFVRQVLPRWGSGLGGS